MKKIIIFTLTAALLFSSCGKKDPAVIAERNRPLQLTEAEAELWGRLMAKNFNMINRLNVKQIALNADLVILELRKRQGD
jgi:hypothetical protein